jgi:hypothetical protein
MNHFCLGILIFLLIQTILCRAASKNVAVNDKSKDVDANKHDFAISMISHSIGGDNYQNHLTLDVSSSSMIHHTWHDTIRIQIIHGDHIVCDSPITQLTKGKFSCLLDNGTLNPGDNVFSVTIYDANTHQIYFERDTHFYFEGAADLHTVSNNIYLWHWPSAFALTTPKKVLLGGGLLCLAALYAKNTYKVVEAKPAIVPIAPFKRRDAKPPSPSTSSLKPLIVTRPSLNQLYPKLTFLSKSEVKRIAKDGFDLIWKIGKIVAIGVGVSIGRIVVIKGITFIVSAIPLFIGMGLRQTSKLLKKDAKESKSKVVIPTSPVPGAPDQSKLPQFTLPFNTDKFHFDVVTLPDGKKIVKSSIWWLEWLGTTLLLTNTGDPYFLQLIRKYLWPRDIE